MSVCPRCKTNVTNANIRCPACGQSPEVRPIAVGGYEGGGAFDEVDDELEKRDTNFELDARAEPKRNSAANQPKRMLDPYEVAVLADFGPAPASLWAFPAYAWRVTRRRRVLGVALAEARAAVASAESVRDDLLARLSEEARPAIEKSPEMAMLLQSLHEVEATSHERERALAGRSQEFAKKVGEIDQNVAAQEEEGTRLRDRLAAAQAGYDQNEELFRRAQAAYKRAEIEFRNAQNVSQGPDAAAAAEAQARMPALLQVVDRRRAELRGPESELDKARAVLAEHQHTLQVVARRIRALRDERGKLERGYAREVGLRSEGVQRAQADRRAALVAVGARLVETGGQALEPAAREAFFRVQQNVTARQLDAERIVRALESADANAVRKGWQLVIGASVAVLLAIVALIALLGRTKTD
jgi:hypothetical protein